MLYIVIVQICSLDEHSVIQAQYNVCKSCLLFSSGPYIFKQLVAK